MTMASTATHAEAAAVTVAGALPGAYRAGGRTGTHLCVVNAPAQLHALLCRTGLHRLPEERT